MSFILDALRKADASRPDQPQVKLGTGQSSVAEPLQRRNILPLATGLIGIIAATVLATLYLTRQGDAPGERPLTPAPVANASARSLPAPSALRDLARAGSVSEPADAPTSVPVPEPAGDTTPADVDTAAEEDDFGLDEERDGEPDLRQLARVERPVETTAPESTPARPRTGGTVEVRDLLAEEAAAGRTSTQSAGSAAPELPATTPPAPVVATPRFPTVKELRLSGRDLPELRVDMHAYSPDPSERLVYINGFKYRKGQTTREDMRVEEITADGVVLDYRGLRFLLPSR